VSVEFPEQRQFFFGEPIETIVPLCTERGGVMIIGSHPGAKCYEVENQSLVPLHNVDEPFSTNYYFNGKEVGPVGNGILLQRVLEQLGISELPQWRTTLVKIFLFDAKDVAKYNALGNYKAVPDDMHYTAYAEKSLEWIQQEVLLAKPKLIVLTGLQVCGYFFETSPTKAKHYVDGEIYELKIGRKNWPVLCLHDPDQFINSNKRNPWPEVFTNKIVPRAKRSLITIAG
jgi:uracil-DNA glycosylase